MLLSGFSILTYPRSPGATAKFDPLVSSREKERERERERDRERERERQRERKREIR
jgi:hypothetical protein